ncbi:hypothetical protein DFJ74DRAFT_247154 [Hyaloraphidium curvatum]|nr:hypothetical protein DFJ74DRAFT_247154 [Hyaloraphidium curvatum]
MSLLSSPAVLRRLLLASVAANLLLAAWGPPWTPLAAAPWTPTREATPGIDLLDEAVPRDGSRPPYEADERAAWRREGVPGTRAGGGVNGPFMDVAVDLYAGLYAQHAEELRYVRRQARLFCSLGAGRCPLQDVELELTYLRLRTMKPKVVWQIAPGLGYSAVWILHALRANGNGAALHSFDAHNASLSAVPAELRGPEAAWHLHEGSAFSSYAGVLAANKSVPDYLFLDSPQRSRDFAVFYAHLIAEIVRVRAEKGRRGRVGVTLHGAYDPRSWSGRFEGRNLRVYPRWMPNVGRFHVPLPSDHSRDSPLPGRGPPAPRPHRLPPPLHRPPSPPRGRHLPTPAQLLQPPHRRHLALPAARGQVPRRQG